MFIIASYFVTLTDYSYYINANILCLITDISLYKKKGRIISKLYSTSHLHIIDVHIININVQIHLHYAGILHVTKRQLTKNT